MFWLAMNFYRVMVSQCPNVYERSTNGTYTLYALCFEAIESPDSPEMENFIIASQ